MDFKNFNDFYPYYLKERSNVASRRLHFFGTCSVISILLLFFFTGNFVLLTFLPLVAYGFALTGHIFFEKKKPMTLKRPFYSLMGDFRMFWDILVGRIKVF